MRGGAGGLVAACLLVASAVPGPASAHDVARLARVHESNTFCLDERSSVSDGPQGTGRTRGELFSLANTDQTPCDRAAPRAGHWLAQRLWVYHRRTASAPIGLCAQSEWAYNTRRVYHYAIYADGFRPMCGPGWYLTRAFAAMWNGERWVGGYVDSGWHEYR